MARDVRARPSEPDRMGGTSRSPKGYLYFAMAFSVVVEMINIRLRRLIDSNKPPADG